ncbi:MAG TPA: helix-turn-helix domain-containing protein [Ferrovaceae bacterium]|nr:helix-turn-helix domain-containing protein [Ferrovaceae bacterium]
MSQQQMILQALKRRWLSPLDALKECGTMKLSTRVGELRAKGYVINDKWSKDKRFKMYKLVKSPA